MNRANTWYGHTAHPTLVLPRSPSACPPLSASRGRGSWTREWGALCLWAWLGGGSGDSEGKGSRKTWSPTWVLGLLGEHLLGWAEWSGFPHTITLSGDSRGPLWGVQTRFPVAQALTEPTKLGSSRAEPKPS